MSRRVGRYTLIHRLGQGGVANVFLARRDHGFEIILNTLELGTPSSLPIARPLTLTRLAPPYYSAAPASQHDSLGEEITTSRKTLQQSFPTSVGIAYGL